GGEVGERCRVGPPRARRRHHAGAQLADHLLGDVGVRRRLLQRKSDERQSARLALLAVAARAVLLDERVLLVRGLLLRRRDEQIRRDGSEQREPKKLLHSPTQYTVQSG